MDFSELKTKTDVKACFFLVLSSEFKHRDTVSKDIFSSLVLNFFLYIWACLFFDFLI